MTPLSSLGQNTANHFCNTSTARTITFNSVKEPSPQGTRFQRNSQLNQDTNHKNFSTQTTTTPTATTGTSPLQSHTFREQEKCLKRFANPKAYKYISRAPTHLEHYSSHLRIRIQYYKKVVSSTTSSAPTSTVLIHT